MGKKAKVGKARKDKYYQLAKDTGYRSRASFKLLQLDRKFDFMKKSSICIDLCAAPGGWLQVAQQYMPVSSIIIGVDLVPIKPLSGIITFQSDITSEDCRQRLKKLLPDQKADLVLHDGAPNLGKNWIHDAYQQAELTLQALRLATAFLSKGGNFVTKVFRSKDYFSLMWVFKQMFRNVHATKPLASRNESAEIFVVCQSYLAPDKIDPKFLDPKHVFKDVEETGQINTLNLIRPEKISKKADGYAEGEYTVQSKLNATTFAADKNYLELLKCAGEIIIDSEEIRNHPSTTPEIIECCKDIRLLGKRDIKGLLNWRKTIKELLTSHEKQSPEIDEDLMDVDGQDDQSDKDSVEDDIEQQEVEIGEKEREKIKDKKRKKKKALKDNKRLREKINLNMVLPGDVILAQDDNDLFDFDNVKKDVVMGFKRDDVESNGESESEDEGPEPPPKKMKFGRDEVAMFDDQGEAWNKIRNKEREDIGDDDDDDDEEGNHGDGDDNAESKQKKKKIVKLSPVELAIGEQIVQSKKNRRELVDASYNRFMWEDDNAPDWFIQDVVKHNKPQKQVSKEMIQFYKDKQKAIDVNPIKKVAEAKARKQFKLAKKLEKARKKTDNLNEELPEKEKMRQAKEIYKKAGLLKSKKSEVTYVVGKKGVGRRVSRPAGVKGKFKVVDPRMKKDNQKKKVASKSKGKKGKSGAKKGGRTARKH